MTQVLIRTIAVGIAFAIGVLVTVILQSKRVIPNPVTPAQSKIAAEPSSLSVTELPVDDHIYATTLCDLQADPKFYDGRLVRITALYIQGQVTSEFTDPTCHAMIDPDCGVDRKPCDEMWDQVNNVLLKNKTFLAEVDVICRFNAKAVQLDLHGTRTIRVLRILDLKKITPIQMHK